MVGWWGCAAAAQSAGACRCRLDMFRQSGLLQLAPVFGPGSRDPNLLALSVGQVADEIVHYLDLFTLLQARSVAPPRRHRRARSAPNSALLASDQVDWKEA